MRNLLLLALPLLLCSCGRIEVSDDSAEVNERIEPFAVDVAVAVGTVCVLLSDGTIECGGGNEDGRLGRGLSPESTRSPLCGMERVSGLDSAVQLSGWAYHFCAVLDEGSVWCWGRNDDEQAGVPPGEVPGEGETSPVQVQGLSNIVQVEAGLEETCALAETGEVYCWSSLFNEELATHRTIKENELIHQVDGLGQVTALAVGSLEDSSRMCAINAGGEINCWSFELQTQLLSGEHEWVAIDVGNYNGSVLALSSTGLVRSFHDGLESNSSMEAPTVDYEFPSPVSQVDMGFASVCAVTDDGLICRGEGELANYPNASRLDDHFFLMDNLEDAVEVRVGTHLTCAIMKDGTVRCWGWGECWGDFAKDGTEPVELNFADPREAP